MTKHDHLDEGDTDLHEEDWGAGGIGGRRKRESELFVFIRPDSLTTPFFQRNGLFFCVAALELAHGLG